MFSCSAILVADNQEQGFAVTPEDPLAKRPTGIMLVADPSRYIVEVRNIMGLTIEAAEAWKGASDSQYAVPGLCLELGALPQNA